MKTAQNAVRMRPAGAPRPGRGNVLVRAVVISTYFADEEDRSSVAAQAGQYEPKGVACDVLTYGGPRRSFLTRVPVMQVRHGLNDYTSTWIPRATTINLVTNEAPVLSRDLENVADDPRDFDGDHVLVQFLENDPQQPIVTGALPHPRSTFRQIKDDGPALRSRHHGVTTSIDVNGNIRIDASQANNGELTAGAESPADDSTHGRVTLLMPRSAALDVRGVSPNGVVTTFELTLNGGAFEVRLDDGATLNVTGKDGAAVTVLGSGAVSAAVAEHMKALWISLQEWAVTMLTVPTGMGPSGPSTVPVPDWIEAIASGKLKMPDG